MILSVYGLWCIPRSEFLLFTAQMTNMLTLGLLMPSCGAWKMTKGRSELLRSARLAPTNPRKKRAHYPGAHRRETFPVSCPTGGAETLSAATNLLRKAAAAAVVVAAAKGSKMRGLKKSKGVTTAGGSCASGGLRADAAVAPKGIYRLAAATTTVLGQYGPAMTSSLPGKLLSVLRLTSCSIAASDTSPSPPPPPLPL